MKKGIIFPGNLSLNNTCREWINILFGMPQGSILVPLLFNIFLYFYIFTLL